MSIKNTLREILNEGIDISTDDQYLHAIQEELNKDFDSFVTPTAPDTQDMVTPEQKLEALTPELEKVVKDEYKHTPTSILINLIIEKSKDQPAETIIRFIKTKYNIDAQLQGKLENILRELSPQNSTPVNSVSQQAQELAECVISQIALVFKPAGGMENSKFVDRSREHVNKYISRVNGNKVEINQALKEMKSLFALNEELEQHMENVFKVAKGVLDENTLKFIKENIGGTTSVNSDTMVVPAEKPLMQEEQSDITPTPEIENELQPSFYTEYRNLYESISSIAESIIAAGCIKEETSDSNDFNFIVETLSKAATIAMKRGTTGFGKDEITDMIMKILHEEYSLNEETTNSLSNTMRHAYEIGQNYKEDFTKNNDLYDGCQGIDMSISMNEILDMFAEEDVNDVDIIEIDDIIPIEEIENPQLDNIQEIFHKRINTIFDN